MQTYIERFDDGPGGWFGWVDNACGPKSLERGPSSLTSRSQLPEGYVTLDEVRITFQDKS